MTSMETKPTFCRAARGEQHFRLDFEMRCPQIKRCPNPDLKEPEAALRVGQRLSSQRRKRALNHWFTICRARAFQSVPHPIANQQCGAASRGGSRNLGMSRAACWPSPSIVSAHEKPFCSSQRKPVASALPFPIRRHDAAPRHRFPRLVGMFHRRNRHRPPAQQADKPALGHDGTDVWGLFKHGITIPHCFGQFTMATLGQWIRARNKKGKR
jgi:hypothetical protein